MRFLSRGRAFTDAENAVAGGQPPVTGADYDAGAATDTGRRAWPRLPTLRNAWRPRRGRAGPQSAGGRSNRRTP